MVVVTTIATTTILYFRGTTMLMNSLSIIVRHSRTFCERKLKQYDIGFPEQVILMYLSENRTVSQDEIAKYFMIDKGAIAKSAGKLEEKDYIERHENPDDKREKLIALSPKGKKILVHMRKILEEWNANFMKGLTEEDIRQFKRITDVMANNVASIND